ncbi:MAG: UpxY family transcription antiterminator [Candidatus Amulumruptor caecigallinarius]|nr:UpxY family transcription antiterminator [Candidatus Amulumruptor caecigallinarius]
MPHRHRHARVYKARLRNNLKMQQQRPELSANAAQLPDNEYDSPIGKRQNALSSQNRSQWHVLRDFKKWNALHPAYKELPRLGIRCFTPMHWVIKERNGKRTREHVPVIQSLLFAHATREELDPVISRDPSLQYQFRRGAGRGEPMTVREEEMERFIRAVSADPAPRYLSLDELTPAMTGKEIIVTGGPLDGYRGKLLKIRGSKKRRLIIKIEGLIAAAVEVHPDFIRLAE